jgi:DNA-binding CsgD family transcriptional regulator
VVFQADRDPWENLGPEAAGFRRPGEISALCQALELSPDATFVTDRRNQVVFSNHAADTLLGVAGGETIGRSCDAVLRGRDVFDNRYCALNCPVMQMAARGECVRGFRLTIQGRDGREVTIEMSVLQLVVAPPDHYYLMHVLHPVAKGGPPSVSPNADVRPPRSSLEVVRESSDARARRLTSREVEVLGMMAAGRTTPEISTRLCISAVTVRNHIQNILEKLEVHSKSEAVAFAFQKRLI